MVVIYFPCREGHMKGKKNMKKVLSILLSITMIAACFVFASCTAQTNNNTDDTAADTAADTGAKLELVEDGKLHMATNAQFPPYELTTDDGGYEGIDIEIATAIAEKLGLELVVDDMEFDAVITSVQQGKSDMAMAGLTVNEERKQNVDFTTSYATGVQVIIVKEGSDIKSADDLANAELIGTQVGTTGSAYCSDDFGADHVVDYSNGSTAVQALVNGQVDAVVIDNEPAKAFVAANEGLVILDTEYVVEDYAIGIGKENTALYTAINNAIEELIEDGTVKTIVDKYITAD